MCVCVSVAQAQVRTRARIERQLLLSCVSRRKNVALCSASSRRQDGRCDSADAESAIAGLHTQSPEQDIIDQEFDWKQTTLQSVYIF